jgi:hypothetical protein
MCGSINYGCVAQDDAVDGLPFLEALQSIVPRIAARDSEPLAAALEAAGAPHNPAADQSEWECYFDLVAAIRDRKSKARTPRSALRDPTSPTKQPGRKWVLLTCILCHISPTSVR